MWKWILGVVLLLVLLVGMAFTAFIWMSMALSLQNMVQDNLTQLRQDIILKDRAINFNYEDSGVEVINLQPAITLSTVQFTLRAGDTEYRLDAPELSVIGGFSSLQSVTLQAPAKVQLTVISPNHAPKVAQLHLPAHLNLQLISQGASSHMWQSYQLPANLKGAIEIEHAKSSFKTPLHYNTPPLSAKRALNAPYSTRLTPLFQKISSKVKLP